MRAPSRLFFLQWSILDTRSVPEVWERDSFIDELFPSLIVRSCYNLDGRSFWFSFQLFFHTSGSFEMGFQPGSGTDLLSVVGCPDLTGKTRGGDEGRDPMLLLIKVRSLDQQPQHHLGACYKCRISGPQTCRISPACQDHQVVRICIKVWETLEHLKLHVFFY